MLTSSKLVLSLFVLCLPATFMKRTVRIAVKLAIPTATVKIFSVKISEEMRRESADRQTDACTHKCIQKRLHYLSHAVLYSYRTVNDSVSYYLVL